MYYLSFLVFHCFHEVHAFFQVKIRSLSIKHNMYYMVLYNKLQFINIKKTGNFASFWFCILLGDYQNVCPSCPIKLAMAQTLNPTLNIKVQLTGATAANGGLKSCIKI